MGQSQDLNPAVAKVMEKVEVPMRLEAARVLESLQHALLKREGSANRPLESLALTSVKPLEAATVNQKVGPINLPGAARTSPEQKVTQGVQPPQTAFSAAGQSAATAHDPAWEAKSASSSEGGITSYFRRGYEAVRDGVKSAVSSVGSVVGSVIPESWKSAIASGWEKLSGFVAAVTGFGRSNSAGSTAETGISSLVETIAGTLVTAAVIAQREKQRQEMLYGNKEKNPYGVTEELEAKHKTQDQALNSAHVMAGNISAEDLDKLRHEIRTDFKGRPMNDLTLALLQGRDPRQFLQKGEEQKRKERNDKDPSSRVA